jgi:tRNA1Val (adenine37-N6)-methyltransferase
MPHDYFAFKQFTIYQDKTAMKVSTDSVLLGAWAEPQEASTILDIGTGTGLLALMMAQKSDSVITAIELNEDAFEQAMGNFERSNWKDRITVFHENIFDFKDEEKFDFIICNPPYFTNSLKSQEEGRTVARHNDGIPFDKLLKKISELLSEEGKFCIIIPAEAEREFSPQAYFNNLLPQRICRVKSKPGQSDKRVMMELGFHKRFHSVEEITIHDIDGNYTEYYRELTQDFYL